MILVFTDQFADIVFLWQKIGPKLFEGWRIHEFYEKVSA